MPASRGRSDIIASLVDATVRYGKTVAIEKLSLQIPRGSFFALVGPNGAGKSTTVRLLATLGRASQGQVIIEGYDASRDVTPIRRRIGVVFQTPSLDNDLTVMANMRIHAAMFGIQSRDARRRIDQLLELVDLGDRGGDDIKKLSGGMKRRVEIARALIHRPTLLFMDEPTVGLDAQTRSTIWRYLRQLNEVEGLTVFFTTHYMAEVEQMASHVVVIDHGRIVDQGAVSELRERAGVDTLEAAYLMMTGGEVRG